MKTNYLLPNKYKKLGWTLLTIGLLLGILMYSKVIENEIFTMKVLSIYNDDSILSEEKGFFKIIETGILDEVISILIIIGGLLLGFTKEK